jgi:hypothetical protein
MKVTDVLDQLHFIRHHEKGIMTERNESVTVTSVESIGAGKYALMESARGADQGRWLGRNTEGPDDQEVCHLGNCGSFLMCGTHLAPTLVGCCCCRIHELLFCIPT